MITPQGSSESIRYSLHDLRGLEDAKLVAVLREGCEDALAILFERYSGLVFSIAQNILKDNGEAEEAVQQAFLDLYRAIDQFNPERGTFKIWLLQFAYHRSISRREHLLSKKFYYWQDINETLIASASNFSPSHLCSQENALLVEQMLATLNSSQRAVIELTYFEGLTADEIAPKLGQSAAAVRNHLYRGLAKLRRMLLEEMPSESTNACGKDEQKGVLVAQPRPL